jgi:polysaccharide biosynthesis protein PslG
MIFHLWAGMFLSLACLASAAAPLAIGVQTHFAFESGGTDVSAFHSWIQRSRFTSSRDEMFWWHVEDSSGNLALQKGALRSQQVWASVPSPFAGLLTVDFGHPSYDSGGQPRSDKARTAFARYADYVTSQSKPHVRWVEVWNEWNMPTPPEREMGNRGEAKDYVDLARTTYQKLKAGHPAIPVLTGSSGDDSAEWRWMRQAIGHGMLTHTDGVAVHLYNHCIRPDLVGSDQLAERLDALHDIVSAAGYPQMPLFVTEVGWPTHQGSCGIAETAAATHSLRFLLEASVRPWVGGVWFYELQDGGDDPRKPEHRFGLLRRDGTEKPAGCALREFGALVAERPVTFVRGKASGTAVFRNGSTDRLLLWTRGNVQRAVSVRLESTTGRASTFESPALCGLPAADMKVEPQGRFATIRLGPRSVHAVDVPAGSTLKVEELP